jgi:hypothetical protein
MSPFKQHKKCESYLKPTATMHGGRAEQNEHLQQDRWELEKCVPAVRFLKEGL